MLSSFVRLYWRAQEPSGRSAPFRSCARRGRPCFDHPLSGQEREDGICHRTLAMRPIGTAMSAPGPEPGPEWHEPVPSEFDRWSRGLLTRSTPPPGMTARDENRRVSG